MDGKGTEGVGKLRNMPPNSVTSDGKCRMCSQKKMLEKMKIVEAERSRGGLQSIARPRRR